ncbi:MerR family transcriptional regulator [Streptomyces goshikiensis]
MRIGELASRAGVSVRSVRYYEEQGLLTSTRSPSGQRHYTDGEVERVAFIQRMYTAGLSRTIVELMPCIDAPSEETSNAALERMARERERLSEHIADLLRTRDTLDALMATARAHQQRMRAAGADSDWQPPASCRPRPLSAADRSGRSGRSGGQGVRIPW